ncbi:MAG: hypothetical protein KatS3mg014_0168 [Actinomycetota bacterium]|nr:MAG: hypothetical protein KatS3mg014_0168 [Actinomycetota bacterium]
MDDVRDLLEEAVGRYRPRGGLEAVEARVRRGRVARRIGAVTVALATLLLPGWLAWTALRAPERPATDTTEEPTRYTDPLGWSAEVPPGWHVLRFGGFNGRQQITGAAIGSVPLDATPDGTYPDLADLPLDAAVVIVSHAEGGPVPNALEDDSTFPLRWEDLQVIPGVDVRVLSFRAAGADLHLEVRIPSGASGETRDAARRIVGSIEPLPLHEGELLPSGYLVVRADRVAPIGSGAVLETARGPFLLVHAPGGYYALGLPADAAGSFQWDEEAREVVWTQDGEVVARYEREGRPVSAPPGADLAPLEIHPVVRAFDGEHLLLHPDVTYGPLPERMWG